MARPVPTTALPYAHTIIRPCTQKCCKSSASTAKSDSVSTPSSILLKSRAKTTSGKSEHISNPSNRCGYWAYVTVLLNQRSSSVGSSELSSLVSSSDGSSDESALLSSSDGSPVFSSSVDSPLDSSGSSLGSGVAMVISISSP